MPALTSGQSSTQQQRTEWMFKLIEIVRQTGENILNIDPRKIFDTVEVDSHQFSTVDGEGSNKMRSVIAETFGASFNGTILEESEMSSLRLPSSAITYPLIIGDAIEGSTNAKRGLAAAFRRPILAGTSAFILEGPSLCTLAASAFFDFASKHVFSSVRGEAHAYLPFIDKTIIESSETIKTKGDSNTYVVVPGYSHHNIEARAQVERALLNAGMNTTDGCRSSAQDILDILANQVDAYVDLRASFPSNAPTKMSNSNEHLHSWDICGTLPVLSGFGFCITDPNNRGWQLNDYHSPLSLIVSRPSIYSKIMEAVKTLPFLSFDSQDDNQSVPFIPNL